jgi:hypothetical protein
MYQALIEIHNYRQLAKIDPVGLQETIAGLEKLAVLYGASYRELSQGRALVVFTVHRPGDSLFVVESVMNLYNHLAGHRQELAGFTILLDSGDGGMEAERHLRKLLVCATEDESLWLGSQAAAVLKPFLRLETRNGLWRCLGRMETGAEDINASAVLYEHFLPVGDFQDFLAKAAGPDSGGLLALAIPDADEPAAGDLVNEAINRRLGKEGRNHYLWIVGRDADDPPPVALTRHLLGVGDGLVGAWLDETEQRIWNRMGRFMAQGGVALPGVAPLSVNPEYPDQLFWQAWILYVSALRRKTASLGQPLFMHLEGFHRLGKASRDMVVKTVQALVDAGEGGIVVIATGSSVESLPWEVGFARRFRLEQLPRGEFHRLGALPPVLAACMERERLPRRLAACVRFLSNRYAQTESLPDAGCTGEAPDDGLVVRQVLACCDDILQEVLYALAATAGHFPLPVQLDFLSYLAIERIRHPPIIQSLFRLGLIRHEELVVPAFPESGDMLAGMLGDRRHEIRDKLDGFLSTRVRERRLPLRMDLFTLAKTYAATANFTEICFRFGQELLDVGQFGPADAVLTGVAERLQAEPAGAQRARLQAVLRFLQARCALLRSQDGETTAALSGLNGLNLAENEPINAYVALQKARVHFHRGESDQALREVKQSVMQFQEMSDFAGLAESHILFGQILLARERLIEARDYFILARNTATRGEAGYQDVMGGLYDIVVVFILGYQSRTLEALSDTKGIIENARNRGFLTPVVFLEFLRGRVWFELGAYHAARSAFGVAAGLVEVYPNPDAAVLLNRWMARCDANAGEPGNALAALAGMPECRESLLFQAEALLMMDRHAEAIPVLERVLATPPAWRSLHPERLAWSDGYANLESKVLPPAATQDTIANLALSYRALCLAKTGQRQEAIDIMFTFTRDKKRWSQDPHAHLYLFLYSRTLGPKGAENTDDCATILGKAVKALQERSSRIEEPAHKQSFLKAAYWNRLLLQEAKVFNLA